MGKNPFLTNINYLKRKRLVSIKNNFDLFTKYTSIHILNMKQY